MFTAAERQNLNLNPGPVAPGLGEKDARGRKKVEISQSLSFCLVAWAPTSWYTPQPCHPILCFPIPSPQKLCHPMRSGGQHQLWHHIEGAILLWDPASLSVRFSEGFLRSPSSHSFPQHLWEATLGATSRARGASALEGSSGCWWQNVSWP